MRLYLDTRSLQRPLDSKTDLRILLEAEAVLGLLALCQSGEAELIGSEALAFEVERNPNLTRQQYALETLSYAVFVVEITADVEERARWLVGAGLKPLDALHLASAEAAEADYLCTCDDRFLRRARGLANLATRVVSPLELIGDIGR